MNETEPPVIYEPVVLMVDQETGRIVAAYNTETGEPWPNGKES